MAKIDIGRLRQESGLSDATFTRAISGVGTKTSRDRVRQAARRLKMDLPEWFAPVGDDRRPGSAE